MDTAQKHELDLDSGVVGYTVVGSDDEPIGEVMRVSLDSVCLLVASHKGLFGRNKEHAIHSSVITDIDPDTMTITIARTREQVEHAPEYSNLEEGSSERLASYYK
jgi:hypothetical protein